jgi:hypothetical protein
VNKTNESEIGTRAAKEKAREKEATAISLLLRTLEDMLCNRILKKEQEVHRTQNIEEKDRLSI